MRKIRSKKSNITFIIFTYNEEKRISFPIKCYLPYGDVIISDDSSTDNTVKIAQNLGARVIKRKVYGSLFNENKKELDFVFSHVNTDWVFIGFADEMIPKTCLNLYKKISEDSTYKIVVQKSKTLFFDTKSEFASWGVVIKFFKKDAIDFSNNKIHQMGKFMSHVKPNEIFYLPPLDEFSIYHFQKYTTDTFISNYKSYTTAHAQSIAPSLSAFQIIVNPIITFLTNYLLGGGFRYGIKGFIITMHFSYYTFLTYAKAYEIRNNISEESCEKKFLNKKKDLLNNSPHSSKLKRIIANGRMFFISRLFEYIKFRK